MSDTQDKLNLTYEIEGLLCLLIERGESAPEGVKELLAQKISQLAGTTDAEEVAQAAADTETASSALFEEEQHADEPSTQEVETPKTAPLLRTQPHFTINDTYRFKRELFSNSNEEWQEALNVLSAMGSYDEAEDYFYNDMAWDAENDEVKAFMEVVKNMF